MPETDAMAATLSERSHATRYDNVPPPDVPTMKIRAGSMFCAVRTSSITELIH